MYQVLVSALDILELTVKKNDKRGVGLARPTQQQRHCMPVHTWYIPGTQYVLFLRYVVHPVAKVRNGATATNQYEGMMHQENTIDR
jgi:hypothetical protein